MCQNNSPIEEEPSIDYKAEMAAERYSTEVSEKLYGPFTEQESGDLPQPLAESIISEAIKKTTSGASGDDSQRVYLHKNEAARGTWLGRCSF